MGNFLWEHYRTSHLLNMWNILSVATSYMDHTIEKKRAQKGILACSSVLVAYSQKALGYWNFQIIFEILKTIVIIFQ